MFAGTGQQGDRIVEGDPTQTELDAPGGVAVLADGSVLIADTWNYRVLCVSRKRDHVEVFAGTGQPGGRIVADDPTQTELSCPAGVAVAADGSVLIADTDNHRVLCVSADSSEVSIVAGTGETGNTIVAGDPTQTQLNAPGNIAVAPDGSVLIADTGNHRVLLVGVSDDFEKELHELVQRGTTAVVRHDEEGYGGAVQSLKALVLPVLNTLRCVNKQCWEAGKLTEEEGGRTSGVVVDAPQIRAVGALLGIPQLVAVRISKCLPSPLMWFRSRIALEILREKKKEQKKLSGPEAKRQRTSLF